MSPWINFAADGAWRGLRAGLLPVVLTLVAMAGLWWWAQRLEPSLYDWLARWSAPPLATDSRVMLVLIDDASIRRLKPKFGPYPWPRTAYPAILARLHAAGPAVMVLDSHFVSLDRKQDAQTFDAMRRFPHFIAGLAVGEGDRLAPGAEMLSYYRLNLGVVSMHEDADGSIRALRPVYEVPLPAGQLGIFPTLSLAAALDFFNRNDSWVMDIQSRGHQKMLALYPESAPRTGPRLPLGEDGTFYLRWYRANRAKGSPNANIAYRSHESLALWRVLGEPDTAARLRDKIIILGASSTFYPDEHATPMAKRHLGADIHATALENILRGEAIAKAPFVWNLLVLVSLVGAIWFIRLKAARLGVCLLYTVGLGLIYTWLAFRMMSSFSLWFDVATPLMLMAATFLVASTVRLMAGERRLAVMEGNLAQLVSPDVFREIRRRADVLRSGGQKLDITVMFVDIRNFTALAEPLPPARVTGLLNAFYGTVVDAVFRHHGTVDKFLGDGILVLFGAPIASEDHAERALSASRDILAAVGLLAADWRAATGVDLDIGISLNTGPAFVGFIGPPGKLEYTAVGDTVNLAARLQEHAKRLHSPLIVSEATVAGVPQSLRDTLVDLGSVSVRGREASLRIFGLQTQPMEGGWEL